MPTRKRVGWGRSVLGWPRHAGHPNPLESHPSLRHTHTLPERIITMKLKSLAIPALLTAILAGCTAPAAAPTSDPGSACPSPASGEQLYTGEAGDYCVLIPSGFSMPPDDKAPSFVGPNTDGSPAIAW